MIKAIFTIQGKSPLEKKCKRILSKRILAFVFISLMIIGFPISYSYGDEDGKVKWGFSILAGTHTKSKPDLILLAILPRLGLSMHKNWDLELEGNFSYYSIQDEKDLYLLGTHANILFKPIRWGKGTFFLIGGGGFAYNNNNGKVKEIGDSHIAGIIHGGAGIDFIVGKGWALRGEYRLIHISDPLKGDLGINTHNFILGVSF